MQLSSTARSNILKGALFNALLNAIINGAISWSSSQGKSSINLTVDAISTTEYTAFSGAISTATVLAFLLSIIAYFTIKLEKKPPFFPQALLISLRNGFLTLAVLATLAILLQRYLGSIPVGPGVAASFTALFSGITAGYVTYITHMELAQKA
jgi:hypothetical protein